MEQNETREEITPLLLFFEWVYGAFPHAVIVCDRADTIVGINAAALQLFEIASPALCNGTSYQQFLQRYQAEGQQQPVHALQAWLLSLIGQEKAAPGAREEFKVLRLPSGRTVSVTIGRTPIFDARQQVVRTISIFHFWMGGKDR